MKEGIVLTARFSRPPAADAARNAQKMHGVCAYKIILKNLARDAYHSGRAALDRTARVTVIFTGATLSEGTDSGVL